MWNARDTRLERSVAIKVLPAELAQNAQFRSRFEREAKTISSLNHPNICTLHDIGCENGIDYLVMELVEGDSLADRIARGPLPLNDVLKYGTQIAEALDKAHRAGIVHRDLKPANIMITKSGAKLLDFGLAKNDAKPVVSVDGATEHKPLTQEGTIIGTFQYMAPEQLEGAEADARTDIFAFGAVLYEMVTGRRAFEGKTRTSLIAAIVDRDPPPISSLQPLTPPSLERIIKICLAKDPDDRWQTAHDVQLQLKWLDDAGSQAGLAAPVIAGRRRKESLTRAAAVAALIAALIFGGLWLRERFARKPEPLTVSIHPPSKMQFAFAVALSPDGSELAFINAAVAGSSPRIHIRSLRDASVRELAGTEGATYPFWAPDGRHLGFFANGKLKRVAASGSTPEILCDVESPRGGTWGIDGTIVFAPVYRDGLFKISSTGGTAIRLTRPDSAKKESNHRWPYFLPDGKHVLFLAQRAEGGSPDDPSTIDVLSIETGERKELVRANSSPMYARGGHLLYWRDKNLLAQPFDPQRLELEDERFTAANDVAFAGSEQVIASVSGNGHLAFLGGGMLSETLMRWVDRAGKESGIVAKAGSYVDPRISPDGKRIAFRNNGGSWDIWTIDLLRNTRSRVTVDPGDEASPVWSPDGKRIAYGSNAPPLALWVVSASGGEAERIWVGDEPEPFDWSRDDLILFEINDSKQQWGIGIFSMKDKSVKPFVQTKFQEGGARFSPDGQWVAYVSDQSGRREVYVQALAGGERSQISTEGGTDPRWNPDGNEIFYTTQDGRLFAVGVTFLPEFSAGIPSLLFDGVTTQTGSPYEVVNGNRFLLNTPVQNEEIVPITLIRNWALLKKN